jgi:hypothetical protein
MPAIVASAIVWDSEPVSMTADEFLKEELKDGPVKATDLEKQARENGFLRVNLPISDSKPFRLAKERLRIQSKKDSLKGGSIWYLPNVPKEKPMAPWRSSINIEGALASSENTRRRPHYWCGG